MFSLIDYNIFENAYRYWYFMKKSNKILIFENNLFSKNYILNAENIELI